MKFIRILVYLPYILVYPCGEYNITQFDFRPPKSVICQCQANNTQGVLRKQGIIHVSMVMVSTAI